jgi:hypothetical protein
MMFESGSVESFTHEYCKKNKLHMKNLWYFFWFITL